MPDKVLLAGNATTTVTLFNVKMRRKAFDRTWKLISQEEEAETITGERTFRRKGLGDYEWLEFIEQGGTK